MARLQLGPIVSSITGSVAGSVFQRTRSGFIIKSKSSRGKSSSSRQDFIKNGMTLARFGWQALTDAQRCLWSDFATFAHISQKHSPGRFVNGWECYLKCNSHRAIYQLAQLSIPFLTLQQDPLSFVNITSAAGNLNLNISAIPDLLQLFLVAQISPVLRTGANYSPQGYRQLVFTTAASTAQDIKAGMDIAWGLFLVPGDRVHLKLYTNLIANGYQSTLFDGITEIQ